MNSLPPPPSQPSGYYASYPRHVEEARLRIKAGTLSSVELVRIKDMYSQQKLRVEYSQRALKDKTNNALSFSLNRDKQASLAKRTTNPIQINDYNRLRQTQTSMYYADHQRRDYDPTRSYKLHNRLLNLNNSRPTTSMPNTSRGCPPNSTNCYQAADGTIYKKYLNPANNQIIEEIDYPTKNVIHVPGKYHELYRQWATYDEIPNNLKHKFRSDQTAKLLQDEIKVHDTLAKIYNTGVAKKNNKDESEVKQIEQIVNKTPHGETVIIDDSKHKDYNELGHLLRHTVSHGNPITYRSGLKEEVHNGDVSKIYFADEKNLDSPYRRKTDWLGNSIIYIIILFNN